MNAIHIESERRTHTVADLLTSRLRPVRILVDDQWLVGDLTQWLRRYQSLPQKLASHSCGQSHYVVTGSEDFVIAVVVMQ